MHTRSTNVIFIYFSTVYTTRVIKNDLLHVNSNPFLPLYVSEFALVNYPNPNNAAHSTCIH